MSEAHKKQLEQQLWNIANTLRGKMDADEFRDYILVFIFFKYLSDPVIIININKKYVRGNSSNEIYESTKEAWV